MSETFWDAGAAIQSEPEVSQPRGAEVVPETAAEDQPATAQTEKPRAFTLSVDEFAGLEARIMRAVSLVKQERQARAAAEERAAKAEAALNEESLRVEQMQTEIGALRGERQHVKIRVERLLEQLDALEM